MIRGRWRRPHGLGREEDAAEAEYLEIDPGELGRVFDVPAAEGATAGG